mmetsp:Transcript_8840/g.17687  ORF Transcript_8840/g.17687 Transcript_8840/m.17687 type:complete len:215 (-) Transcript_8840:132-776(-)|eukprot:scaffold8527_cov187-Amphora_coffeaeformis.AAC.3
MGKIQQLSAPVSIVMESPAPSPNSRRRGLLARGKSIHMFRSSSMPRLFPSPVKKLNREDSAVWGNDSCDDIKFDVSLGDDDETAIVALLKELTHAIDEQSQRKASIEKHMKANFRLANARYAGGSRMGTILSMRMAHKNKTMKAYIAAARFQLISIRKDLETSVQAGYLDLDVSEQRSSMNRILAELTVAKCPTPSDEELIRQLERSMSVETPP